jgi:hypothetical protein
LRRGAGEKIAPPAHPPRIVEGALKFVEWIFAGSQIDLALRADTAPAGGRCITDLTP